MSIKIHGKEYVMVHERIQILHEKFGSNVSINTEIIADDEQQIIMKATISIGNPEDDEKQMVQLTSTQHLLMRIARLRQSVEHVQIWELELKVL